jgi:hypothetical protein
MVITDEILIPPEVDSLSSDEIHENKKAKLEHGILSNNLNFGSQLHIWKFGKFASFLLEKPDGKKVKLDIDLSPAPYVFTNMPDGAPITLQIFLNNQLRKTIKYTEKSRRTISISYDEMKSVIKKSSIVKILLKSDRYYSDKLLGINLEDTLKSIVLYNAELIPQGD